MWNLVKIFNQYFRIASVISFLIVVDNQNSFAVPPSGYVPFASSNAIWKAAYYCLPPCFHPFESYFQDSLGSDTVINSLTYKKLYRTFFDVFCDTVITYIPGYNGGIRQDTIQKRVYYIDLIPQEYLLYRFDVNIGDTIQNTYNMLSPHIVTAIDTTIINGSYRRRFEVLNITLSPLPLNYVYIIEGIGSENGLIERLTPLNARLFCYAENNLTLYIDTFYNHGCHSPLDSCFTASIKSIQSERIKIIPYFNPIDRNLYFNNSNENNFTIEFYDLFGREVLNKNIQGELSFYISLPNAVYYYRIYSKDNGNSIGRIILF